MKKPILSLLIFGFLFSCTQKQDTTRQLIIHFPDSAERTVTLRYSIKNLINFSYEPYFEVRKVDDTSLVFEIPDSVSTFTIAINGYSWSSNYVVFMTQGEKLEIILDTVQLPLFVGKYADFHKHIHSLKFGTAFCRMEKTLVSYIESEKQSFFIYINNRINESLDFMKTLLADRRICEKQYQFAESQIIDEFLFRAILIGQPVAMNVIDDFLQYAVTAGRTSGITAEDFYAKIDAENFFSQLNDLVLLYDRTFDYGISALSKATLRMMGLIPFEKVDLGLSPILISSNYLSKEEQEMEAASVLISMVSIGRLDADALETQRALFQSVFPNSIYNSVLNRLEALIQKDFILAHFSIEGGFNELGRFETDNTRQITSMFLGGKPVLVSFWATWCAPCLREFQYSKKINDFLSANNIGKLYVSIDFAGAYEQWKEVIISHQLEGFHYFATNEFVSKSPYEIHSIPRYMLLDSNGNILIESTELPSSGRLIEQIKNALN